MSDFDRAEELLNTRRDILAPNRRDKKDNNSDGTSLGLGKMQGGAPIPGFNKYMQEVMEADLWQVGSKGTEANLEAIFDTLKQGYKRFMGLNLQAAVQQWQGQDSTQLKTIASEGLSKMSTQWNAFVNNTKLLKSDNPSHRKAAASGINKFVGNFMRGNDLTRMGQTGLAMAQSSSLNMQSLLTYMSSMGSQTGMTPTKITPAEIASVINSLREVKDAELDDKFENKDALDKALESAVEASVRSINPNPFLS